MNKAKANSNLRIVHRRPRPFHIIELNYKGGKKKRKVHLDQVYQAGSHPQPEGRKRDPPSEEPVPVPHCTPSVVPKKSYKDRKKEECQAWAEIKCHLQRVAIEQQGVPDSPQCTACQSPLDDVFRCRDCDTSALLCHQCVTVSHRVCKLHHIEVWKNETFVPFDVPMTKTFKRTCDTCHQSHSRGLTLIDEKGRVHQGCTVTMCACEPESASLLRFGFWPLSPKSPVIAVSTQLLDWLHYLTLEAQVSVQNFVDTLMSKEGLFFSQNLTELRRLMRGESVSEYRVFKTTISQFPDQLESSIQCPACPKKNGELFVSLDANFGLVHKQNSGHSCEAPQLAPAVFLSQADVDAFVNGYDDTSKKGHGECSSFQAGDVIRSKNKTAKLTYTGVFAAACRHEIPVKMFNLCHGERLAYAVHMLNYLLDYCAGKELNLHVLYDISCVLQRHLQKRNNTRVLEAIQFAIPVFHSYGHKEDCQVCLNPRRLKGFGLVDGEQLERLWSYLRLFAKTTKEMTPSHRLDMLAMAVALYSHKKQLGMDKYLVDKLNRAVLVFQSSGEKVDALLEEFHLDDTQKREMLDLWKKEERQMLAEKKTVRHLLDKHDIKETYVRKLRTYYFLREQMTDLNSLGDVEQEKLSEQVSGLNEDLCAMEVRLKISQRWQPGHIEYQTALLNQEEAKKLEMLHKIRLLAVERDFLVGVRSKYSEGQSVANRVTVALRRVSSALTKKVAVFNSLGFSSTEGDLPATISLVDAKDTSSDLFLNFEEKLYNVSTVRPLVSQVANSTRRRALEAADLHKRAAEEQLLIKQDMLHLAQTMHEQHAELEQQLRVNCTTQFERGRKSLVILKLAHLEHRIQHMSERYSAVGVPIPFISQVVYSFFPCSNFDESDDNDDNDEDTYFLDDTNDI